MRECPKCKRNRMVPNRDKWICLNCDHSVKLITSKGKRDRVSAFMDLLLVIGFVLIVGGACVLLLQL